MLLDLESMPLDLESMQAFLSDTKHMLFDLSRDPPYLERKRQLELNFMFINSAEPATECSFANVVQELLDQR